MDEAPPGTSGSEVLLKKLIVDTCTFVFKVAGHFPPAAERAERSEASEAAETARRGSRRKFRRSACKLSTSSMATSP